MNFIRKRILAMIAFILVVVALGLLARRYASMGWLVENEAWLRDSIRNHAWQGWFLGLVIYTALSLVPGMVGKSVVCGWLYGFWKAVLMVDLALTIAAIAGFTTSRYVTRDAVNAKFARLSAKLDRGLEKDGVFYLLMSRMAHLPFSMVNYGAGATSVSLATFIWTTAVGILPGTMVFVFVGTRIPTLESLAQGGTWQLFDNLLVAILAAMFVFPVLIRWAIGRFRQRAGSLREIEPAEIQSLEAWRAGKESHGAN
jgi:uncharacterized membrane protein YdjX (TVP38/TMEM64 family)